MLGCVEGVVQVDARENCEDVGLKEGDQNFKPHEKNHEDERNPAADNAEANDEAAEHG